MLTVNDDRNYGNSQFSVGRIKYNLGRQSSIGVIGTLGNSIDSLNNSVVGLDMKLGSAKFMGRIKLISLILYGLKSNAANTTGKDASWGGLFLYPNDFLNIRFGHLEIGENFVAGMGYVPRNNIKETFGSLIIGPRLNRDRESED